MDGSSEQPQMTAGLDLGDRYSYLCLIDTESGEVIEEGRLRTTPEAFRRRFASEQPLRIAIEAGTHSPWVSRLLEGCAHEVEGGGEGYVRAGGGAWAGAGGDGQGAERRGTIDAAVQGMGDVMDQHDNLQELLTRLNNIRDSMEEALGDIRGIEDDYRRGLLEAHIRGAIREINAQITELVSSHQES
jgi:hypothetical protein